MIRFLNFVSIIVSFVILAFGVFNYVNRDHTTIYVGVDSYSAPFSMTSDIGDLKGFGVDLMRAVANALDVNVEFRMIPFYVLQDSLRRGTVDAVVAPFDSNLKENQLNSNFTVPYFKNNLVFAVKDDLASKYKDISSMSGVKFCVTDKPDVLKYLRSKYKNSVIMIFASSEDAFSGLYKEQCATFVDSKSSMYYYISKHRLRKLTVKDIPFTGEVTYKIAVRDNKAELLNKINKGLDYLMSTREIDEISKKWFSIPSDL